MNGIFQASLIAGGVALAVAVSPLDRVSAQEAVVPVPDPVIGSAPTKPSNAQETYDQVAIQQAMKLVELSRTIGGGISQFFGITQRQLQFLQTIRDAQTGVKAVPLHNDADEAQARQSGPGLNEMASAALNGAPVGPQDLKDALATFRAEFKLDKAFALKDDESISKMMIARASAQGAIAASTAEDSYKRADASMGRLSDYLGALQTSADLKTSIDINTRATIELVQQQNESLRTQAAIALTVATYFMIMGAEAGKDDFLSNLKNFNR